MSIRWFSCLVLAMLPSCSTQQNPRQPPMRQLSSRQLYDALIAQTSATERSTEQTGERSRQAEATWSEFYDDLAARVSNAPVKVDGILFVDSRAHLAQRRPAILALERDFAHVGDLWRATGFDATSGGYPAFKAVFTIEGLLTPHGRRLQPSLALGACASKAQSSGQSSPPSESAAASEASAASSSSGSVFIDDLNDPHTLMQQRIFMIAMGLSAMDPAAFNSLVTQTNGNPNVDELVNNWLNGACDVGNRNYQANANTCQAQEASTASAPGSPASSVASLGTVPVPRPSSRYSAGSFGSGRSSRTSGRGSVVPEPRVQNPARINREALARALQIALAVPTCP